MPALPTNLVKVGSIYKYRARIPQDLLPFFAPKREVVESLRTKSLAEAKRLLPAIQLKYQTEWACLQAQLSNRFVELTLNDATMQYITALFEHESLAGDEQTRLDEHYTLDEIIEYRERLSDAITEMRDLAALGNTDAIRPALDEYLRLKRLHVTGSEADYKKLTLAYLRGAIKTNTALLARMNGEDTPTPATPKLAGGSKATASSSPPTRSGITLYALFEYWRDAVPDRPARTLEDFERRVRQMDELTGNKPADQLTKADFIAFRDAMLAKGKAAVTVEKDLSFLKAIMRYAHESDKIPSNPTAGIKVSHKKVRTRSTREIDPDALKLIFTSPLYTEQLRPEGGGGDAAVWLPLLGLYTGARVEEIAQLRVDDVRTQDDITYIRIIDIDDKDKDVKTQVKTEDSRRNVPLPPAILNAGFLNYVEHIKTNRGDGWLFPDLAPDRYGKRSGNWIRWWSRWRNSIGVSGRDKCFHAFRHTFKSACRESHISEDQHDALTGHEGGGIGRRYGKFPLTTLDTAMRKLRFPGFEVTWVWEARGKALGCSGNARRENKRSAKQLNSDFIRDHTQPQIFD